MKRNLLLIFLFLKEIITSSTIKIIEEKETSIKKADHFFSNNDFIRLPNFYIQKIFYNNMNFSKNSSYNNEQDYNSKKYAIKENRVFVYREIELNGNKGLFDRILKHSKFLSSIDIMKLNLIDSNSQKTNEVKIKLTYNYFYVNNLILFISIKSSKQIIIDFI